MSKVYEAYLELEEQCSLSSIDQVMAEWDEVVEDLREEFENEGK